MGLAFGGIAACGSSPRTPEGPVQFVAQVDGRAQSVTLITTAEELVARRHCRLKYATDGTNPLPAGQLVLTMPSMDHGATFANLQPANESGVASAEVVFVMGGEWEVELRADEGTVFTHRVFVREP